MHQSVVIDASVWASRLMARDTIYVARKTWADQYYSRSGLLVVPEYLLVEIAAVLTRQANRPHIVKRRVRSLYSYAPMKIEPVDADLLQASIDIAADLCLKAGDTIYVALANRLSIPPVTWDNEQLNRASALIETFTPDTFPF